MAAAGHSSSSTSLSTNSSTTTRIMIQRHPLRGRKSAFSIPKRLRRVFIGVILFAASWSIGFWIVSVWWHLSHPLDANNGTNNLLRLRNLRIRRGDKKEGMSPAAGVPSFFSSSSSSNNNYNNNYESPLLIFTCRRAKYLSETLEKVLQNIPHHCRFGCPLIVSEDGHHDDIQSVVQDFQRKYDEIGIPLVHLHHIPTQLRQGLSGGSNSAYVALAEHYGWALTHVFDGSFGNAKFSIPQRVVILEEDIRVAPDFFSYMQATANLLDTDPTLLAVSAFNDNGHHGTHDPQRLLRSDFFPGLGWMMTRTLWKSELQSKWPEGYWDDWLRDPTQRQGRQIIRPEISRTYHFGRKGGASANQFGSILERVKLNEVPVDFAALDLSYLTPSVYDRDYMYQVKHSRRATSVQEALEMVPNSNVLLSYAGFPDFKDMAQQLDLMDDEKAGVPRTSYKGIVETRPLGDHFLFLAPIDVL